MNRREMARKTAEQKLTSLTFSDTSPHKWVRDNNSFNASRPA